MVLGSSLRELSLGRDGRSKRVSSFDRTGGNSDFFLIRPGEVHPIAELEGCGKITHIWITTAPADDSEELYLPRKIILRMYWDGEEEPSVEVPLGDFFGLGHGITKNYASAALMMSPEDGKAFNCFFPMPFASGARLEVESQADQAIKFYFYVNYEEYDELMEMSCGAMQWNSERITQGIDDSAVSNEHFCFGGNNVTGSEIM